MARSAIEIEIAKPNGAGLESREGLLPRPRRDQAGLVNDDLAVSDGALRGVFERPPVLETVRVTFPSGRSAAEQRVAPRRARKRDAVRQTS